MMLLRRVEEELRRSGMSATRFGLEAAGDPRLVHDLRRGRRPGQRMKRQVEAFIAARPAAITLHPAAL